MNQYKSFLYGIVIGAALLTIVYDYNMVQHRFLSRATCDEITKETVMELLRNPIYYNN